MTSATRNKKERYLLGQPLESLPAAQLPTGSQVLRRLYFMGANTKENRKRLVDKVIAIWERSYIPTMLKCNITRKLVALIAKYENVMKSKNRKSNTDLVNATKFEEELSELFDISHQDALQTIKIEEDRRFLMDQRGKRKMSMGQVDNDLRKKSQRVMKRTEKEAVRVEKEKERRQNTFAGAQMTDSSQSSAASSKEVSPERPSTSGTSSPPRRLKVTPSIAAALDRTNMSHRKAAHVMTAIAEAEHKSSLSLPSSSTIYRARRASRSTAAADVRAEFVKEVDDNDAVLVLHWDGKLMANIDGEPGRVDRLALVVSSPQLSHEKLLAVPLLRAGTGAAMANKAAEVVAEWELEDRVGALSFDTTASNTGVHSGCCKLLEEKVGRPLLHLACRHHILELLLAAAFKAAMGTSSGPEIVLFKQFRDNWPHIEPADAEVFQDPRLDELKEWCTETADVLQAAGGARDDYRELAQLVLAVVTGQVPDTFRRPGAVHHARWMAKALYAVKIVLLKSQFRLTQSQEKGLRELVLFVCTVYARAWFQSPRADDAAVNDLALLRDLIAYHAINPAISDAVVKTFRRHLWYLGTDLAVLSLFSEKLSPDQKTDVVASLEKERPGLGRKRWTAPSDIDGIQLHQLVSSGSRETLEILKLPTSFLAVPVNQWANDDAYQRARALVQNLSVTNDGAERGIKMITDFNSTLTKDETEKQHLLQVIEAHRRLYP